MCSGIDKLMIDEWLSSNKVKICPTYDEKLMVDKYKWSVVG